MSNTIVTSQPVSRLDDKPPSYEEAVTQQPSSIKEAPIEEPRETERRRKRDCCLECTDDTLFWYLHCGCILDCCMYFCKFLENCLDSFYDGCGNCCNKCFCGCCEDNQDSGVTGNAGVNVNPGANLNSGARNVVGNSAVVDGDVGAIGDIDDVGVCSSGASDISDLSVSDCGCFD